MRRQEKYWRHRLWLHSIFDGGVFIRLIVPAAFDRGGGFILASGSVGGKRQRDERDERGAAAVERAQPRLPETRRQHHQYTPEHTLLQNCSHKLRRASKADFYG